MNNPTFPNDGSSRPNRSGSDFLGQNGFGLYGSEPSSFGMNSSGGNGAGANGSGSHRPGAHGSGNGSSKGNPSPSWLQDSVRTFFTALNWDGHALSVMTSPGQHSPTGEVSMTMPVSVFFGTIPWEGQPIIAAPVAPLEMQSDRPEVAESLTLDAFSDLF